MTSNSRRKTGQEICKMLVLLAASLLIAFANAEAFIQIDATPSVVQTKDANLKFGFALSKAIKAGFWIRFTFPKTEMTVSANLKNCKEQDNQFKIQACTFNSLDNYIQITLDRDLNLEQGSTTFVFTVSMETAVDLPMTIRVTQNILLTTQNGEVRSTTFGATVGGLGSVALKPSSDVVGADTTLNLSIVSKHSIPRRGNLMLQVTENWNQGAPDGLKEYFSSITCDTLTIGYPTGEVSADPTSYDCTFLSEPTRVIIEGGFDERAVPSGAKISINLNGFRNPIQANKSFPVFNVYTTGLAVKDVVDQALGQPVTVTKAHALAGVSFAVSSLQTEKRAIVQQENVMKISFSSPVPFKPGCKVSYWFPTAFYDASEITEIRTGSMFSLSPETFTPDNIDPLKKFTVKSEDKDYKSLNFESCPVFRRQGVPETTRIRGLKQPLTIQETSSLKIVIKDREGEPVVFVDQGVTFVPLEGSISLATASHTPTTVSALSYFTFQIKPEHSLFSEENPVVKVAFPNEVQVQDKCDQPASCETSKYDNSISIKNVVTGTLEAGTVLTFTVGPLRLPESTRVLEKPFKFITYMQGKGETGIYEVDSGSATPIIEMTSGRFTSAQVSSSSDQSFVKADLRIEIQPEHQIPQYAKLMVVYPEQVSFEDPYSSQSQCDKWTNFASNTGVCTIHAHNRTIIISKGFQHGPGGKAGETVFSWVVPYMTNPPTLERTATFRFFTLDQHYHIIDESTQVVTLKMKNPAVLTATQVKIGDQTNGKRTTYRFEGVTSTTIFPTEYARIQFPRQCVLPATAAQLACSLSTDQRRTFPIDCKFDDKVKNAVVASLAGIDQIAPGRGFNLTINEIMNPNSTFPSDVFSLVFYDDSNMTQQTHKDPGGLFVQTSVPFTIPGSSAEMERANLGAGLPSKFVLKMALAHDIAKGGGILIRYPPQVQVSGKALNVTVDARQYSPGLKLTIPTIDFSARQIVFLNDSFTQPLVVDPLKKQQLVITIEDLVNPMSNEASSSFEIVTFNQNGNVLYLIDQVDSGLSIENSCNFPCKGCLSTNPNYCTACDLETPLKFLEQGTCLSKCSKGRFLDASPFRLVCERCDGSCLTCEGSAKNCTSCGITGFIHLRGSECVDDCGSGYINDPSKHRCLPCKEGCTSCSKSTSNCTSCEALGATPLLFDFECLNTCPAAISVFQAGTCKECSPNCVTCSGEPSACSSCASHKRLDRQAKECVDACKPELQIYDEESGSCLECNPSCATCVERVDLCSTCQEGLALNMDSTCEETCEGGEPGKFQTTVKGVCQYCEEPCNTCDKDNLSLCRTCIDELPLLYNNTCVDHCPDLYLANNATINQCVLVGLICPEGFHITPAGDGCIPNEFECEQGFEINPKNTACIPVPGTPVPFPFFFMAICMTMVVAYSKLKESSHTKVCTSLIFLLGSFELLQYLLIAVDSLILEQYFASLLAFVAFTMLMLTNLGFGCMYKKSVLQDTGFKNWIRIFPKTKVVVPVLCVFVNFKFIRFVFSGFFGLENSQAVFRSPMFSIHRPLKFATYFKYVFVYSPIFVADVVILASVDWGHQLTVLAIETFVLQLLVIILTYFEFREPETMYQEDEIIYSPLKGVMAGIPDEIDEQQLLRLENCDYKHEIVLRKKALTEILKQVGHNFTTAQRGVDIGNEIPKVFTKFNKHAIKLKRAFSMEDMVNAHQASDLTLDGTRSSTSDHSSDGYILKRRYSFPLEGLEEDVIDPIFEDQLDRIRQSLLEDRFKDNVYAEPKPPPPKGPKGMQKKKKMVNRRTQTYLRELLQVEGEELMESDMEVLLEEDVEIDDKFTRALIDGVISDGISESIIGNDESRSVKTKRPSKQKKDTGIVAKVSKSGKRPEFDLGDIMGEFEIDDSGNYIILRGDDGKLMDKNGQVVNKRGYLVDKHGNIINKRHELIFKVIELDSDDEIPAPVGFDKRKQNLLNMKNSENIDAILDSITKEMVPLEREELRQADHSQSQMISRSRPGNQPKNRIQSSLPPKKPDTMVLNTGVTQLKGESKEFRQADRESFEAELLQIGNEDLQELNLSAGEFWSKESAGPGMRAELQAHSLPHAQTMNYNASGSTRHIRPVNFYAGGTSGNVSAISHDLEYLHEGLQARPGHGKQAQRPANRSRLAGEAALSSQPHRPGKSVQKAGQRILSGDPRLKGLEQIYLRKFGNSSSNLLNLRHMKSQSGKGGPPALKKVSLNNFRATDIPVIPGLDDHRQLQAAQEIDRLEHEYLSNSLIQNMGLPNASLQRASDRYAEIKAGTLQNMQNYPPIPGMDQEGDPVEEPQPFTDDGTPLGHHDPLDHHDQEKLLDEEMDLN